MTLDDFSRLHRRRIDDCLSAQLEALPAMAPRLRDAMKYGLLLGGKRVRPFLVYAVGEMLGVPSERLDGPAAAVESYLYGKHTLTTTVLGGLKSACVQGIPEETLPAGLELSGLNLQDYFISLMQEEDRK